MFDFSQVSHFAGWDPAKYLEAAQLIVRESRDSLGGDPLDGVTVAQCDGLDELIAKTTASMASGDTADMRCLWDFLWERRKAFPKIYSHTSLTDFAATGLGPDHYYREHRLGVACRALQQALEFSWT
jgi:hypothetical protein